MLQFIFLFSFAVCSINAYPDVCWRDYIEGDIPSDALVAYQGLYVGQIPVNGMLPATIYSGKPVGVTESNGKNVETSEGVKILCSKNLKDFNWVQVTSGNAPSLDNLVLGGTEGGRDLYIGRAFHENQWKIGKYQPWNRVLSLWTASGVGATVSEFHVLEYSD